ncbi:MarR family winged helix-turn-helix transcriptional regulator [Deinococcus hopiensis]|uniref:Transcriptional regulator, MarR family n=1 Tax=Deinococcus hopiensis KR-140 TaxID=695939 RepID=A0A1W1UUC1_9DEIO|nr:MarR family winged helix-turn-helix transcriptional regulator [Deinococcus hopiensis]SMB84697.1 transcriptional regulator, MarR family [Deinococcus hopiensis KR-140]
MAPPPPDQHEEVSRFLGSMWRFNRAFGQQLEPLLEARHGLEARSFFVMKRIGDGDQYPKMLAGHLKIPPTLISRYLDGLVKRGLIERHIDEQDSRRTRLSLTGTGQQLLQEAQETVYELAAARLGRLPSGVLQTVINALDALSEEGPTAV